MSEVFAFSHPDPAARPPAAIAGLLEPGNIDLQDRPRVENEDGSTSTVRSASFGLDGAEVLLPTVSDDGRLLSNDEAVAQYRANGKHLGKFLSPEAATAYAMRLHTDQERMVDGYRSGVLDPNFDPSRGAGWFEGSGGQTLDRLYSGALTFAGIEAAGLVGIAKALEVPGAADLQESIFRQVVDVGARRREIADQDAARFSLASNIISGVATLGAEAVLLTPYGAGAIEGVTRTAGEVAKGRAAGEAGALGAVEGLATTAFAALPFSIPARGRYRYLLKAGYGVMASLGAGEAARQGELAVLPEGDPQAKAIEQGANRQRLIEGVMGLFFGAAAALHLRGREYAPKIDWNLNELGPKQEIADAAMTAVGRALDDSFNPGEIDPHSAATHTAAMQTARASAEAGDLFTPQAMGERQAARATTNAQEADAAVPAVGQQSFTKGQQQALEAVNDETGAAHTVEALIGERAPAEPPAVELPAAPQQPKAGETGGQDGPEAALRTNFRPETPEGTAAPFAFEQVMAAAAELEARGVKFSDGEGNDLAPSEWIKQQAQLHADAESLERDFGAVTQCVLGAISGE